MESKTLIPISGCLVSQTVAQSVNGKLKFVRQLQLGKDGGEVVADRGFRNPQVPRYLLTVETIADKSHNFSLSRREGGDLSGFGILLLSRSIP